MQQVVVAAAVGVAVGSIAEHLQNRSIVHLAVAGHHGQVPALG